MKGSDRWGQWLGVVVEQEPAELLEDVVMWWEEVLFVMV